MLRLAALLAVLALATAQLKPETASAVGARLGLCARTRPDFDDCMQQRLQNLLPELAQTGIPEVGVPNGEPYEIPEMLIHYSVGNMSADLRIRNSRTWGVSGIKILSAKSIVNDPKVFHFEVGYLMPRVYTEGDYKVDARLVVPIVTKGYFNISMTDVSGVWNVTGEHYQKRGRDYVRITKFNTFPDVGDMEIFATNLIPGNPELSEYILALSNQYWRPIYAQMLPDSDSAWSKVMIDMINRVFASVPFDDLFPSE